MKVKNYLGKSELDGIYDSLVEKFEKKRLKELKELQKEAGKMIIEEVEKKYPKLKGKFTVEWYQNE